MTPTTACCRRIWRCATDNQKKDKNKFLRVKVAKSRRCGNNVRRGVRDTNAKQHAWCWCQCVDSGIVHFKAFGEGAEH